MFEFQGWATIKESYDEAGECEQELDKIYVEICKKVKKINSRNEENRILQVSWMNGTLRLFTIGADNRMTDRWRDVYKLFKYIANRAMGSYGILSCWDLSDENGQENEIQNYVLKRGTLMKQKDTLLSPCVPEIEAESF